MGREGMDSKWFDGKSSRDGRALPRERRVVYCDDLMMKQQRIMSCIGGL